MTKYAGLVRRDMLDNYPPLLRISPRRDGESDDAFYQRIEAAHIAYREDYDVFFATGRWPQRQRLLGR